MRSIGVQCVNYSTYVNHGNSRVQQVQFQQQIPSQQQFLNTSRIQQTIYPSQSQYYTQTPVQYVTYTSQGHYAQQQYQPQYMYIPQQYPIQTQELFYNQPLVEYVLSPSLAHFRHQDDVLMGNPKITTQGLVEERVKLLRDVIAPIFKLEEEKLRRPPCEYAVIALGSIAREEATVYSDLEYAILCERTPSSSDRSYFKKLAENANERILSQFKEGGKSHGHDVKGIMPDPWNKTPAGNNMLINDSTGFLEIIKNGDDPFLPIMLTNTFFIRGNQNLFYRNYEKTGGLLAAEHQKHGFKSPNNMFIRVLNEDRTKYLSSQDTNDAKKHFASLSVLNQYSQCLNRVGNFVNNRGNATIDPKVDIYRPIQTIIENYGGAKGWFQESMFQIPYRLGKTNNEYYISTGMQTDMLNAMHIAVNSATEIRDIFYESRKGRQNPSLSRNDPVANRLYDLIKSNHEAQKKVFEYVRLDLKKAGHNV